ncbi:MAG: VWA domain-containing protein [Pyrinomonadaceae bacterium]|nr:VWA domain-containing protein [Pyrinomonadaceae bacterium]
MTIFRSGTRKNKENLTADKRRWTRIKTKNYRCLAASIGDFISRKSLFIPAIPVNFLPLRFCVSALKVLLIFSVVSAQTGVLIPSSLSDQPDPKVLSLAVMNVDILIDNQQATVRVVQIFDNHTGGTLEGKYLFALPPTASVADFAVWDNDLRIPGVMMEKRRANKIYEQIKQQKIDPGLLQQDDEHGGNSAFSAKIFPINAYGTKRLEMEYTETLPVENLQSQITFPLKPAYGAAQRVGELNLRLRVLSDHEFTPVTSNAYPMQIIKREKNEFVGEYHAQNVELKEDFAFNYNLNINENAVSVIAYRAPETISVYDLRNPLAADRKADGYFQAQAVFARHNQAQTEPKRLVLMLDTSLSMYGDKLARAVEAVDFFLHDLTAQDKFNLVLFNDEVKTFSVRPVTADARNVEEAMDFIRHSMLGGGTNLKKAFEKAVEQSDFFTDAAPKIILISDANPTLETVQTKNIAAVFEKSNAKLFAFALGADVNENLLKELTGKTQGFYAQARETEDIALGLQIFLEKLSSPSIADLKLFSADDANLYDIYATGKTAFAGSSLAFVGRFRQPKLQNIEISGDFGTDRLKLARAIALPERDETHSFLPRVWAKARISWLLQLMNEGGEREDFIQEIIALSEKYKIVSPYTAFIAAPRALLRPRLIQPGDPVIRVKADESITEIFAVLPFGETLPLTFLEAEKVWETRFLAPVWMTDGSYRCRLLLRDKNGGGYEETKTFVIDSRAPKLKISLENQTFRAGATIKLKVSADSDTNRLTARIYGAKPVSLRWSNDEKANVGVLQIPENLASGKYVLTVTAEDFAHNQATEEMRIEILGS